MEYDNFIANLKEDRFYPKNGEFYDFNGLPIDNIFKLFWDFACTFFKNRKSQLKIDNPILIFNTNIEVNAAAYIDKGYSVVEFNKGAFFNYYNLFLSKDENFLNGELIDYKNMTLDFMKVTPGFYMFQFVMHLFLTHEIGHLIQKTEFPEFYTEFNSKNNRSTEENHVIEFDADWFGANEIAHLLAQLNINFHGDFDNPQKIDYLHKSAELALAGIYVFLINSSQSYSEIYFKSHSHPHPSVRLIYIIHYFIDTLNLMLPIELDQDQILKNSIRISAAIMNDQNPNPIELYSLKMLEDLSAIDKYIKEIIKNCANYSNICRNKLNTTPPL
jgi:hypothetical protein